MGFKAKQTHGKALKYVRINSLAEVSKQLEQLVSPCFKNWPNNFCWRFFLVTVTALHSLE